MKRIFFIIVAGLLLVGGLAFFYSFKHTTHTTVSEADLTQLSCSGIPTVSETEGPFYKAGSPQRNILYNKNIPGEKFTLTGFVVDTKCKPISHAWLDFWQANGNGVYDNSGFTLRGHQYTDSTGKFSLTTVIPGEYPGRTPHIHVKVRATDNSPILTTQLYIPGLVTNAKDAIYNSTLQMHNVIDTKSGKSATFTFVLSR